MDKSSEQIEVQTCLAVIVGASFQFIDSEHTQSSLVSISAE